MCPKSAANRFNLSVILYLSIELTIVAQRICTKTKAFFGHIGKTPDIMILVWTTQITTMIIPNRVVSDPLFFFDINEKAANIFYNK